MTPAEASTATSLLEKPLSQLTEEDIGQITREECRRFLKERGMRRPSWNKSQAIQQVISLKALLEGSTDPDSLTAAVRIHRKPGNTTSPPLLSPSQSSLPSPTEASGSGDLRSGRMPTKDPSAYRRRDLISPGFTVSEAPRALPAAFRPKLPSDCLCPPFRTVADDPTGQLTIFYDGKVNIYEGVPTNRVNCPCPVCRCPLSGRSYETDAHRPTFQAQEIFRLASTQEQADSPAVAPFPSGSASLHRFPPPHTGPVDRGPSAGTGFHLNAPAGKLQSSYKDSFGEGRTLREPLPGKRAEIGNGGSGGSIKQGSIIKKVLGEKKGQVQREANN